MKKTNAGFSLRSMVQTVAHAFGSGKGLDKEIAPAQAGAGAVRKARSEYVGALAPKAAIAALKGAVTLDDTDAYFQAAEALEESDLQFRSLISTRKDAIVALPLVVDPFDNSRQAKKVAELCREVADGQGFKELVRNLADAIAKGYAVAEIVWDRSKPVWTPAAFIQRPMEWFEIDKTDGRTLRLKQKNGEAIELEKNRFIVHTPNLKSGMPIRAGLAFAALLAAAIKALALTDWAGFCEIFGQPLRVGRYAVGTPKADVLGLKKALESMGANAYALLPQNMAVEFINAGGATGNAEVYEKLARYVDENFAKLVLGQTLTSGTGDGGSYALGRVQNEVRVDILKSDAASEAEALCKYLFRPLVDFNFGPDVPLPHIRLEVAEAEDLVATKDIVRDLAPLLPIPRAWLYDKFSIPEPQEGEAVLIVGTAVGPAVEPPAGAGAPVDVSANTRAGCPVHSAHTPLKRDSFDGLAEAMAGEWEEVEQTLEGALLGALEGAGSFEEMRANIAAFVRDGDVSMLAEKLTKARALAQLVGQAGGDIGGAHA